MLAGPSFPPVPLIVLVATEHDVAPEREALWQQVQAQTAALSPKGRLKIVQGAGHFNKKSPQQAAGYWGSKAADRKHAASCGEYIPKTIQNDRPRLVK